MCDIIKNTALNKEFFYCREHKEEAPDHLNCAKMRLPIDTTSVNQTITMPEEANIEWVVDQHAYTSCLTSVGEHYQWSQMPGYIWEVIAMSLTDITSMIIAHRTQNKNVTYENNFPIGCVATPNLSVFYDPTNLPQKVIKRQTTVSPSYTFKISHSNIAIP